MSSTAPFDRTFQRSVWARVVFLMVALLGLGTACRNQARSSLPIVELSVNGRKVTAEVAHTVLARTTGLMYREHMGADEGMLFVFPDSAPRSFWMRNTLLPLSIAYLDEEGVVLNIEEMLPQTDDSHISRGPAKYALEMNAFWFDRHGLTEGVTITGLERAPRGQ